MNNTKIIPFTQAASERRKTAPHWLILIFAASPYNLPELIRQALNLLEYKKETVSC